MTTIFPITRWYAGKALATITGYVIPMLIQAEEQGYWPKGASRKVRAALNKQTVAIKFARKNDRDHNHRPTDEDEGLLDDVGDVRGEHYYRAKLRGSTIVHSMMFGQFERAPETLELCDKLAPLCRNEAEREAVATAREWAADFAPVATLVEKLDATRPKPVLLMKTLSRTVLDNVGRAIGVDLNTIRSPEIEYHEVQRMMKIGGKLQEVTAWIPVIKWPERTRHNVSKFISTDRHDQCQACGHAIKNAFNWVPLLCDTPAGPASLWVGRDCAEKLFGCDVSGEADWSAAKAVK